MLGESTIWAIGIYIVVVVVMSGLSFLLYGFDKRRATLGGRRIRERSLHAVSLFGGWPGAFLGQRRFRHKTRKLSFLVVFWLTLLAHLSAVAAVVLAVHSFG